MKGWYNKTTADEEDGVHPKVCGEDVGGKIIQSEEILQEIHRFCDACAQWHNCLHGEERKDIPKAPSWSRGKMDVNILHGLNTIFFKSQILPLNVITPHTSEKLNSLLVFVCFAFVEAWLGCTSAGDAAHKSLEMLNSLIVCVEMYLGLVEAIQTYFARHTWYLPSCGPSRYQGYSSATKRKRPPRSSSLSVS